MPSASWVGTYAGEPPALQFSITRGEGTPIVVNTLTDVAYYWNGVAVKAIGGIVGGGVITQNEGTPLGSTASINFVGDNIDAAGINPTVVTVTGLAKLAGGNSFTGAQTVAFQTLTDAANIATNATLSNNFIATLGGNRVLDNPTNLRDGGIYNWLIKQDGTGARTLSYGWKFTWPGATTPVLTTTAGALDSIRCIYNAALDFLVCTIVKDFLNAGPPCTGGPVWTARSHSTSNYNARSCGYGGGSWVISGVDSATGFSLALYSSDRISWTLSADTINVFGVGFDDLCFGGGVFIARATSLNALRSSNGGVNWTSIAHANSPTSGAFFANGNFFICRSTNSNVLRSTDLGLTFGTVALGGTYSAYGGATNGTRIVLVHQTGALYSDDNGATWTSGTVPAAWIVGSGIPSVAFGNGKFIVVMRGFANNQAYASTDGATWTNAGLLPVSIPWDGLIFSQGIFMANGNAVATPAISTDTGTTWAYSANALPAIGYDKFAVNNAGQYVSVIQVVTTALASGEC